MLVIEHIMVLSIQVNKKFFELKILQCRDAIKSKETTEMTLCMWCNSTMDDGYIFKLTFLAHVNFTPHKPYIVATLTHDMSFE